MYQKIFYVNVVSGRFCREDNPHEYGARPSFRHGETAEFDLVCLNDDGTPFYAGGAGFILAVDDNVNHSDELAAMSDDIIAEGNIIHVNAGCFSSKFASLVADGETTVRFFELSRVENGERRVFVYDDSGVKFFPRVRLDEGVPEEEQTLDFVTRSDLANAGYVSAANVQQVVWASIGDTIEDTVSAHDGANSAHAALFAEKAALEHKHAVSDVDDLQSALDGKAMFVHRHVAEEVSGLQSLIDDKAALVHEHVIGDVETLQSVLDSKADSAEVTALVQTLENTHHIVETDESGTRGAAGYQWYRLWSDGWLEQGGIIPDGGSNGTTRTITLFLPFSDNKWCGTKAFNYSGDGALAGKCFGMYNKTTTSFKSFDWGGVAFYACGWSA